MYDTTLDTTVNIAGVKLRNPVIAASGTFGKASEYSDIFDISLLGGICTKGLTMTPRPGNTGTRIWETPSGMLNSIGLQNVGIPYFLENELPAMRSAGPVIIANLSGGESNEYIEGALLLDESSIDIIELNISCPNVKVGGMAFGLDPGTAAALVSAVKRSCRNKPIMVKLSPNAPNIANVALACVNAGADALSLINTVKAMAIDIENRKPVFENVTAGLSGPAIKPIALRMVWEIIDAMEDAKLNIPIVGLGGIACTNDAVEFLMAGASAIQIGSAIFSNPHVMPEIIEGIRNFMTEKKINTISELSIREKHGKSN